MVDQHIAKRLKIGVAVAVGVINVSVFCIWIPARLQVSPRFVAINDIWDRIEKVVLVLLDVGLNGYFLYLTKSQLISHGLSKYKRLFNFNVALIVISISMDVSPANTHSKT